MYIKYDDSQIISEKSDVVKTSISCFFGKFKTSPYEKFPMRSSFSSNFIQIWDQCISTENTHTDTSTRKHMYHCFSWTVKIFGLIANQPIFSTNHCSGSFRSSEWYFFMTQMLKLAIVVIGKLNLALYKFWGYPISRIVSSKK